jgi:hypothetical protein
MKALKSSNSQSFTSVNQRSGTTIPSKWTGTLRYAFNGIGACSTSYAETVFAPSSAFDPGGSSDTFNPIGFDELALWYLNYRVHSAKIKVRCSIFSTNVAPTSTAIKANFALFSSNSNATANTFSNAMAQPGSRNGTVELGKDLVLRDQGSYQSVSGLNPAGFDSTVAAVTGNPASMWYFHVGSYSQAAYTDCSTTIQVTLDLRVSFYNRKILALNAFSMRSAQIFRELGNEISLIRKSVLLMSSLIQLNHLVKIYQTTMIEREYLRKR